MESVSFFGNATHLSTALKYFVSNLNSVSLFCENPIFEINIRASTILGFVGAGGIGQELYLVINFNYYEEVSAIILLIIFTVVSIDLLSGYLRKNIIEADND